MFSVLESDCLQTNNTENQTFDNAEAFNITEIYTLIYSGLIVKTKVQNNFNEPYIDICYAA